MGMILERLALLHRNMKNQEIDKQIFEFKFRNLQFSIIYIAEQFPHELLFGCVAKNLFFVVPVAVNYTISTYLGGNYKSLIESLGLQPNPDNQFSPNVFFKEFNEAIPRYATFEVIPTMTDIAVISKDIEEADKIYFYGWLQHNCDKSKPSEGNLAKTKRICGNAPYNICQRYLISSRWTDNSDKKVEYHSPIFRRAI